MKMRVALDFYGSEPIRAVVQLLLELGLPQSRPVDGKEVLGLLQGLLGARVLGGEYVAPRRYRVRFGFRTLEEAAEFLDESALNEKLSSIEGLVGNS